MTFKTTLASMTLMLLMIPGAYASPVGECKDDIAQMKAQIKKNHHIKAVAGELISSVYGPAVVTKRGKCATCGYVSNLGHVKLFWKLHNWSNTLNASAWRLPWECY